jgi:hypothetical protein
MKARMALAATLSALERHGFFGVGWLSGPASDRDDPGAIPAGGIGLRYLIARKLGLRVGLDVGFSHVDQIVYVQTGSAW